ncbi:MULTISPECIES: hypothetical protein [unclassified Rhodococcus (in: high G+C Gram-positive bacteria)]|uniref:hypothetical protein n=1 Tax=unclassified Rhodococcus (in: high G+C Gram-positive bacteria) TaxID=192944 RepID=UPI00359318C0
MHRPVLEQQEDRSADIATSAPTASAPTTTEVGIRPETAGPDTTGPHTVTPPPDRTSPTSAVFSVTSPSPTSLVSFSAVWFSVFCRAVLVVPRNPHLERRAASARVSVPIACERPHSGTSAASEFVCKAFECVIHLVLLRID